MNICMRGSSPSAGVAKFALFVLAPSRASARTESLRDRRGRDCSPEDYDGFGGARFTGRSWLIEREKQIGDDAVVILARAGA